MLDSFFKKAVFISLASHLAAFSIFGFSFGRKIPPANYSNIYFWGQFLAPSAVLSPVKADNFIFKGLKEFPLKGSNASFYRKAIGQEKPEGPNPYFKPHFILAFDSDKGSFEQKLPLLIPAQRRQEQTIIFHPSLPYSFSLYFNDRQVAHVELLFSTQGAETRNTVIMKRKISSGNLEVDLLTMRYISHYLFLQQSRLSSGSWQTVKIDLSAKND